MQNNLRYARLKTPKKDAYVEARCLLEHALSEVNRAIVALENMNRAVRLQPQPEVVANDQADGQKVVAARLMLVASRAMLVDVVERHVTQTMELIGGLPAQINALLVVERSTLDGGEELQTYLRASRTISEDIHIMYADIKLTNGALEKLIESIHRRQSPANTHAFPVDAYGDHGNTTRH